MEQYSVFCDESCHLPKSPEKVMLLGCVYAPTSAVKPLSLALRDLKETHRSRGELKWNRVSSSRRAYFLDLINFFFSHDDLHFRVVVVPDKTKLDHATFNEGSHDTFYYKMYFSLLSKILSPSDVFDIYIDIKDTRSNVKVQNLRDILCRDRHDFSSQMIRHMQHARSHQHELMQLADFLIGAVGYRHRGLTSSSTKVAVVSELESRLGRTLLKATSKDERKFNIFVWRPQERTV